MQPLDRSYKTTRSGHGAFPEVPQSYSYMNSNINSSAMINCMKNLMICGMFYIKIIRGYVHSKRNTIVYTINGLR